MSAATAAAHLDAARADAIASGAAVTPREAAHLLGCAACRSMLARRDPSAILGVLAHAAPPLAPPALASLELPLRPRRRVALRRATLAAAAAGLAAIALYWLAARPVAPGRAAEFAARGVGEILPAAPGVASSVVRHVDAPGARIVTLLPPRAGAPSVTLILGTEIDL